MTNDELFGLPDFGHQEELLSLSPVARRVGGVDRPVARVLLDMPQPHMDHLFDYEIPEKMAAVEEGARVVVNVGQRKVDGFVVGRSEVTQVASLRPLARVVSPMRVLTPEVLELARAVAARQATPVADCLRLAIPQRHARAEREFFDDPPSFGAPKVLDDAPWSAYIGGPEFATEVRAGSHPSAAVQMRARDRVHHLLPFLLSAVREAGESVLIVVPTPTIARQLAADVERLVGETPALMLSQDEHATRYRTFLAVLTGRARIVVGTRAAAWAPLEKLGMVVVVDDHHSALRERRSPYVHAREVLALRAKLSGASFVSFNFGPSPELAAMVQRGQVRWITPALSEHRGGVPQIMAAQDFRTEGIDLARMPSSVFAVTREGLTRGPVLFLVPEAGYVPVTACNRCRELATCPVCGGWLAISHPGAPLQCSRCSQVVRQFRCASCGGGQVRAARIGSQRTAQEVGRAFRGTPVHVAGVGQSAGLDGSARIVVSTPGVVPDVEGGYAAAVVLDSGYLLRSNRLDAEVHFLRTIAHAAAHTRARSEGGKMLVVGDVPTPLVGALHTWDMAGWAEGVLSERGPIALPPTSCWVEVRGDHAGLRDFLGLLRAVSAQAEGSPSSGAPRSGGADLPVDALLGGGAHDVVPGIAVLGPQVAGDGLVAYLRFPESERAEKTAAVYAAVREASARRVAGVRVRVDPEL